MEKLFEKLATVDLEKTAVDDVSRKFDGVLDYHSRVHSAVVVPQRVTGILRLWQEYSPALISDKDILIGRVAASTHDIVQIWDEAVSFDGEVGMVRMKRRIGDNEDASWKIAQALMDQMNWRYNRLIFTNNDKDLVQEAIKATIPGFDIDLMTVVQPFLNKCSDPVTRALALADIGSAGLDPVRFLEDGNELFREENLDIKVKLSSSYILTEREKENIRERMIGWSNSQPKFAKGREIKFLSEIEGIPHKAFCQTRRLFNKFSESICASSLVAKRREKKSFEELVFDFGYKL